MEKIKTYLVEVVLRNVGPKVAASVVSALVALLAAHQQLMEKMGVTYYSNFSGTWSGQAPTGQLITIELDTLSKWGAIAFVGALTLIWSIIQHHTVATVTGAPQSGDVRKVDLPVIDGKRATDPPKEA